MTPIGTTRNHGVSHIHRPGTDHRSAFDPGSIKSEAPGCNRGLHHGGEYGNHRSCARQKSIAGAGRQHRSGDPGRCPMSSIPEGWFVDVNGPQIVVRVSGRPDGQFHLTLGEARALRVQLHLAYLLAGRNTAEAALLRKLFGSHPELRDADISHDLAADLLETYKSYMGRPADSPAQEEAATEPGPLPVDWRIAATGGSVDFVVPAIGAGGRYTLTQAEALAAGVALIRQAERARYNRMESRRRAIEEGSSEFFASFYGPDYLEDLRRDWPEDDEAERGGAE